MGVFRGGGLDELAAMAAIVGGEGGLKSSNKGCFREMAAKGPRTLSASVACFLSGEVSSELDRLFAGRALLRDDFNCCSARAI